MNNAANAKPPCKSWLRRRWKWLLAGLAVAILTSGLAIVIYPPRPLIAYLHESDDSVYYFKTDRKTLALTIDDGPHPETTPLILAELEKHNVRATFFVLGERAEAHPDQMASIVNAGHEIGNHGWSDRAARSLSAEEFKSDFRNTQDVLSRHGDPRMYRPGGGRYNANMRRVIRDSGMTLVVGSVYPNDAHIPSTAFSANYILTRARRGDIVVLHDGPGRGERTVEVLARIIPLLQEKGFEFVTLSEAL